MLDVNNINGFNWNDNLSSEAINDYEIVKKRMPYTACQSIGMALRKLQFLEEQGARVKKPGRNLEYADNPTTL